ncbi:hypothetical protein MMC07_008157, partial [Pseudocyphellaria aurata]|nr:hypothetical protein [Pseudocyphellaria aurata]
SLIGQSLMGQSLMGQSLMGQSLMGQSLMGQSLMGQSLMGQSLWLPRDIAMEQEKNSECITIETGLWMEVRDDTYHLTSNPQEGGI